MITMVWIEEAFSSVLVTRSGAVHMMLNTASAICVTSNLPISPLYLCQNSLKPMIKNILSYNYDYILYLFFYISSSVFPKKLNYTKKFNNFSFFFSKKMDAIGKFYCIIRTDILFRNEKIRKKGLVIDLWQISIRKK